MSAQRSGSARIHDRRREVSMTRVRDECAAIQPRVWSVDHSCDCVVGSAARLRWPGNSGATLGRTRGIRLSQQDAHADGQHCWRASTDRSEPGRFSSAVPVGVHSLLLPCACSSCQRSCPDDICAPSCCGCRRRGGGPGTRRHRRDARRHHCTHCCCAALAVSPPLGPLCSVHVHPCPFFLASPS